MNLDYKIIVLFYILFINLINLILFREDKKRARNRAWRIPESTLLIISLMGGSIGGLIGMNLFKHKTKKLKFTLLMPLSLLINIYVFKTIINMI